MTTTAMELELNESIEKLPITPPSGGGLVSIRCVAELHTTSSSHEQCQTLHDQTVKMAADCPFVELIPTVLQQLGYSAVDCVGATGTVQIRNWKPVSCDSIADSPSATVGSVLGGALSSIVTLNIRLHRVPFVIDLGSAQLVIGPFLHHKRLEKHRSRRILLQTIIRLPKQNASEEIKDRLLTYLISRLEPVLNSSGCPIDKAQLDRLVSANTDDEGLVNDSIRSAFDQWYSRQVLNQQQQQQQLDVSAARNKTDDDDVERKKILKSRKFGNDSYVVSSDAPSAFSDLEEQQLNIWFACDQNPSDEVISTYSSKLESKFGSRVSDGQIATWFANRRRVTSSGFCKSAFELKVECNDVSTNCNGSSGDDSCEMSSASRKAFHASQSNGLDAQSDAIVSSRPKVCKTADGDEENDDRELEIVYDGSSDATEDDADVVDVVNGSAITSLAAKRPPRNDSAVAKRDRDEGQEEATDLRVRKKICRSDSGTSVNSSPISGSASGRPSSAGAEQHSVGNGAAGDYFSCGSSNSSGDSPIGAQYHSSLNNSPGSLLFPALPPAAHPLTSLYQHHQRALQLAAMSRAAALGLQLTGNAFQTSGVKSPIGSRSTLPNNGMFGGCNNGLDAYRNYASLTAGCDGKYSTPPNASLYSSNDMRNDDIKVGGSHLGMSGGHSGADQNGAKRSRVFIDPLTEIPKLERWFDEDTHPSSYIIEKYTDELNRSPYRQRFPKLEPKNLQLWFKNHRAKMKRQREACSAAVATAAAVVAAAAANVVPSGERNNNVNGVADSFDVIRKMASQPFVLGGAAELTRADFKARLSCSPSQLVSADTESKSDDDERNSRYGHPRYGRNGDGNNGVDIIRRTGSVNQEDDRDAALSCSDTAVSTSGASGFTDNNSRSVSARNGNGYGSGRGVSGALDALILRLQNGPFAAHSLPAASSNSEVL